MVLSSQFCGYHPIFYWPVVRELSRFHLSLTLIREQKQMLKLNYARCKIPPKSNEVSLKKARNSAIYIITDDTRVDSQYRHPTVATFPRLPCPLGHWNSCVSFDLSVYVHIGVLTQTSQ